MANKEEDNFTLVSPDPPKTGTPCDAVDGNSTDASVGGRTGEGQDDSHPNKQMDYADVSQLCDVCGKDDKAPATKFCPSCSKIRLFCDGCFIDVHKRGAMQNHVSKPIESEKEMKTMISSIADGQSKTTIASSEQLMAMQVMAMQQRQHQELQDAEQLRAMMRQQRSPVRRPADSDDIMQMLSFPQPGAQRGFIMTPSSDNQQGNHQLITDVATTACQMDQAKTEIKQLEKELKEMKEELRGANERNRVLEKNSEELQVKYMELNARYNDLKHKYDALRSEHEELKAELKEQKEQSQKQSRDIDFLKEQMALIQTKQKKTDAQAEMKHAIFVNMHMYKNLIKNLRKAYEKPEGDNFSRICDFTAADISKKTGLPEDTWKKIDDLYHGWKVSRNYRAHPTCLMADNVLHPDQECAHDDYDCQNRKVICDYITKNSSFRKVQNKLVEQCSLVSEVFADLTSTNIL